MKAKKSPKKKRGSHPETEKQRKRSEEAFGEFLNSIHYDKMPTPEEMKKFDNDTAELD